MKRDDLYDLAAFAVVAERGSFTRAAAELGMSQSALSLGSVSVGIVDDDVLRVALAKLVPFLVRVDVEVEVLEGGEVLRHLVGRSLGGRVLATGEVRRGEQQRQARTAISWIPPEEGTNTVRFAPGLPSGLRTPWLGRGRACGPSTRARRLRSPGWRPGAPRSPCRWPHRAGDRRPDDGTTGERRSLALSDWSWHRSSDEPLR